MDSAPTWRIPGGPSDNTGMKMRSSWNFADGDEIAPGRVALARLGGGRYYEAYAAWDERLFAPVVAKTVRPAYVEHDGTLAALQREARMLGGLNHPVVPRLFATCEHGATPHLVLEHLDGPRLSTLLRRHGPLAPEQLLPLVLDTCAALHYLRGEGVVHLDVKPANIIMGAPPRLIDFSLARTVEDAAGLEHPVGTDAYMAPEQYEPGADGVGPAADVWALGATLFEACAGYRPFPKDGDRTGKPAAMAGPLVALRPARLPRQVPDALGKPILACLDPAPEARPTPAELARELEPLVDELPAPVLGGFRPS